MGENEKTLVALGRSALLQRFSFAARPFHRRCRIYAWKATISLYVACVFFCARGVYAFAIVYLFYSCSAVRVALGNNDWRIISGNYASAQVATSFNESLTAAALYGDMLINYAGEHPCSRSHLRMYCTYLKSPGQRTVIERASQLNQLRTYLYNRYIIMPWAAGYSTSFVFQFANGCCKFNVKWPATSLRRPRVWSENATAFIQSPIVQYRVIGTRPSFQNRDLIFLCPYLGTANYTMLEDQFCKMQIGRC